jgi:DNA-directed RNA polymerase subunit RPC12/RpoP
MFCRRLVEGEIHATLSEERPSIARRKGLVTLIIIAVMITLFFAAMANSSETQQKTGTSIVGDFGGKPATRERASPNGTLILHIVDLLSWQGISAAYIVSRSQPSGQAPLSGLTNLTGYATFNSLMAGDYQIIVSKNSYLNFTLWATINQSYTNRYAIPLQSSFGSMSFNISESSMEGNPIPGVTVVLTSISTHQSWVNYTDSNGVVLFDSVPVGNYTISFSKSAYYGFNMTISILSGQNPTWIITLAAQPGTVLGGSATVLPVLTIVGILGLVGVISVLVVASRRDRGDAGTAPQKWQTDNILGKVEQQHPEKSISSPSRRVCPYCGSIIETDRGTFCSKCGSSILAEKAATFIPSDMKRVPAIMGICIVCKLKMKQGDDVVRCPYCGYSAHKTHMLEWLHVKGYCPVCHRHLDEEDFQ